MAEIKSFPNNQDEYQGAEWLMRWHHGRTSGVFGADEKAAVKAVADTMAVTVSDGLGWLSNSEGNGIVWWVDHENVNGSPLQLAIPTADSVLGRIDRVVVSWQTTNYVARPNVEILKGTPSSTPVPPALTNNTTLRQISLASINVPAGTLAITPDLITDERLNPEVCGIVTEQVKADTSIMNAQYLTAIAKLEQAIAEAWDGEIPNSSITAAKIAVGAVSSSYSLTIAASEWNSTEQSFTVSGLLAEDTPIIDWGTEGLTAEELLAASEEWAKILRIAVTAADTITVTVSEAPAVDITLRILCIRR